MFGTKKRHSVYIQGALEPWQRSTVNQLVACGIAHNFIILILATKSQTATPSSASNVKPLFQQCSYLFITVHAMTMAISYRLIRSTLSPRNLHPSLSRSDPPLCVCYLPQHIACSNSTWSAPNCGRFAAIAMNGVLQVPLATVTTMSCPATINICDFGRLCTNLSIYK